MTFLVFAGSLPLFDYNIWGDYTSITWGDLSSRTWEDVFNPRPFILLDTLEISDDSNHRSTASFTVLDNGRSLTLQKGMEVKIYNGSLIFAGIIDSVEEQLIFYENAVKQINVNVVDYTVITERRIVSYAYNDYIFCGEIVEDIYEEYLEEEGLTVGEIQYGEELPRVVFPFKTIAEIFDTLAQISGYIWFIDYDKKLYFIERSTFSSDWDIMGYDDLLEFSVTDGNPQYRNVQYVIGPKVLTQSLTEYFKGDGEQRTFTVGYPIAEEPTIYVNDVIQDVGIKGVEEGKDWYWNKNDPVITQDQSATPLSSSDTLKVEYIGTFPLVVKVSQYSEITARKLIEGFGTGKYENVETNTSSSDYNQALATAQGLLNEYGTIGKQIQYKTLRKVESGSLQYVELPDFNLNYDFLITSVRIRTEDGLIVYEVTGSSGPVDPSWEEIFCKIAKNAKEKFTTEVQTSDVVQGLEEFTKVWGWDDVPNPFREIVADGSATPSNTYFPCFSEGDRFVYCSLYKEDGTEFFRKPITYQDDDGTTVTLITIINANEGNDYPIGYIGIWGGDTASDTLGSGIELFKTAFSKTKSELESLQLNVYMVRGWV